VTLYSHYDIVTVMKAADSVSIWKMVSLLKA
jgi:hypothetical protein